MSFRGKLIAGIAAIQIVLLISLLYIHVKTVENSHIAELSLRADTTISLFANIATTSTLTGDIATIESYIEDILTNDSIVYTQVFDDNKQLIAQGRNPDTPDTNIIRKRKSIGNPAFEIGFVEIGFSQHHLDDIKHKAIKQGITIGLIGLVIATLFAFLLGNILSRQLTLLQKGAERISEGDLGYQLEVKGKDEIAQTANSFNSMSNRINSLYIEQDRVNTLLHALSQAQTKYIATTDHKEIFEDLIQSVLTITGSQFGFIGEIRKTEENGSPYLHTFSITNISWDEDSQKYFEENTESGFDFYNLDTLFGAAITTGLPVISNNPSDDSRASGIPAGHPPLKAFLGMPLYSGNTMIGLIGMANREGGYDHHLIEELQALWTVSASIIGAYRSDAERIHMEKELRASEERFSLVAQGTNDGMWDWDLLTGAIYYSARWKEMLGIDETQTFERFEEWQDLVAEEDLGYALQIWTECMEGKRSNFSFEYRLKHTSGDLHWILCRGTVFKNNLGKAIRMAGSHTDITLQKNNELELEKNAQHTRAILDNVVDVILTLNKDGVILESNPAIEATLGYQPEEINGKRIEELISLNIDELISLDQQEDLENEANIVNNDGDEITIDIELSAITNKEQKTLYICVIRDITQRKKTEIAIKRAHEAAIDAAKTKSEFLANMSHEIRTPLHGILGMLQLTEQTSLNEKQKNFVTTAHRSASHLLEIINDILDFSKIEAGKMELENIPFNLREVIEDVTRLYAPQAHQKSIVLQHIMPSNIPDNYYGDPAKLKQIFNNLVSNALKFTQEGSVLLKVAVLSELKNEATLRIEVEDTGIGISGDAQKNVFSAFEQADNTMTRKYGGTGLGLAICKQLAELMNGELYLLSSPGNGARFIYTGTFQYAQEPQLYKTEPLKNKRALLIDVDNRQAITNSVIQDYLEHWHISLEQRHHKPDPHDLSALINVDYIFFHQDQYSEEELSGLINTLPSNVRKLLVCDTADFATQTFADNNISLIEKPLRQSDVYNSLIHNISEKLKVFGGKKSFISGNIQFKGRILLVEDNLVNQEVSKELLTLIGLDVDIAGNGLEALELTKDNQYDLILMDCQMPEMDGFEATLNIRQREQQQNAKEITIIALTANAMKGDREKCLAVGMNDYLSKPFTEQQLVETLSRWIHKTEVGKNLSSEVLNDNEVISAKANTTTTKETKSNNTMSDIINYGILDTLKVMLKDRFPGMIDKFETNAEKLLVEMTQAFESKDTTLLRRAAHTLKGSSGTIGAQMLHAASTKLEEKAKAGELEQCEALIQEVKNQYARFKKLIPEIKKAA